MCFTQHSTEADVTITPLPPFLPLSCHCCRRNSDRASDEDTASAKGDRDEVRADARRHDERRTAKAAHLGDAAGEAAVAEALPRVDRGIEKHAVALGFGSCGERNEFSDVSAAARRENVPRSSTPMPPLISHT